MDNLLRDLRHAARALAHSPAFTAGVVLCLGLGIGASTSVFSWMEGLILRPLPAVRDMDRLVSIKAEFSGARQDASFPEYRDWRDRGVSLSGLAAFSFDQFGVQTGGAG